MKIILAGHIHAISGTVGSISYVTTSTGLVIGRYRPAPSPRDPSPDQQRTQEFTTLTSRKWNDLTIVQQDSWQVYAQNHFQRSRTRRRVKPSGRNTFSRINFFRLLLQQPLTLTAPLMPPPPDRIRIEPLSGLPADTIAFRVTYRLPDPSGYRLLVRVANATVSSARKVQMRDFRYVNGISPASAQPLPQTGEPITFTSPRLSLSPGSRYGIEVRLINADGIAGESIAREYVRS